MPDPTVGTYRFDDGIGTAWYLCPPVSDSGDELRDIVVKPVHVTGRLTNASFIIYGYQPTEEIDVAAIEAGTGGKTNAKTLPNSTSVKRSARVPINVPNCSTFTIRLAGDCSENPLDRIDEIVIEIARQGVRR